MLLSAITTRWARTVKPVMPTLGITLLLPLMTIVTLIPIVAYALNIATLTASVWFGKHSRKPVLVTS